MLVRIDKSVFSNITKGDLTKYINHKKNVNSINHFCTVPDTPAKHYYNKIHRYAEKASGEMYTRLMKFKIFARMESPENIHRIILVTLNQGGEISLFISLSKPTLAKT